jgi:hypothetical protein
LPYALATRIRSLLSRRWLCAVDSVAVLFTHTHTHARPTGYIYNIYIYLLTYLSQPQVKCGQAMGSTALPAATIAGAALLLLVAWVAAATTHMDQYMVHLHLYLSYTCLIFVVYFL